jgi:AcrR family transcriptional regulator
MKSKKSTRARLYRQQARAESAAETRQRIIDVTRACLTSAPLRNVGLPEIAGDAGVARSTIYSIFGSREGLMLAVAEDLLTRGGFARLGRAFRHPDAVVALETSLAEAGRLYESEHAVGRAILRLAAVDRDAARGAARLEYGRKEGVLDLARRLAEQGRLRPDVSVTEAADVLWIITSFDTFDQLHSGRGLDARQAIARLVALARRAILSILPPPPSRQSLTSNGTPSRSGAGS